MGNTSCSSLQCDPVQSSSPPSPQIATSRDDTTKSVIKPADLGKTEIFVDHNSDSVGNEEEERGEERDLSLESIMTTNGAIPSSSFHDQCLVPGPHFQLGTAQDLRSGETVPQTLDTEQENPTTFLESGNDDSSIEVVNKTDEEKLTSISLSDEEKLTAIYLCNDYPDLTSITSPHLESINIDPEDKSSAMAANSSELREASSKSLTKKDIWEVENGSGTEDPGEDRPPLPCQPPPIPAGPSSALPPERKDEKRDPSGGTSDDIEAGVECRDTDELGPEVEEEVETRQEDCGVLAHGSLSIRDILDQFPPAISAGCPPDTQNVTSLQVEWTEVAQPVVEKEEEDESGEVLDTSVHV